MSQRARDAQDPRFFEREVRLSDIFAAAALLGLIAEGKTRAMTADDIARYAYEVADAMLSERENAR